MKKIVFMLAAVAMAAVANAATVSWTILGVTEDSTSLTKGHTYMFFADSAAAASSAIAALAALEGQGASALTAAMESAAWDDTKKATAAGTFSIGTTAALGSYTLPTNEALGLDGSTKYYAYAVIFDTETITDESNYIIAENTSASGPTIAGFSTKDSGTTQNASVNLGNQSARTWHAVGGSTIPEPTSGLLMLVGLGALALRRRR